MYIGYFSRIGSFAFDLVYITNVIKFQGTVESLSDLIQYLKEKTGNEYSVLLIWENILQYLNLIREIEWLKKISFPYKSPICYIQNCLEISLFPVYRLQKHCFLYQIYWFSLMVFVMKNIFILSILNMTAWFPCYDRLVELIYDLIIIVWFCYFF